MATSDEYAQAAQALHRLLQQGHDGLGGNVDDLVVAARARDQLLRNLHHAGLYVVGATDPTVRFGTTDLLRHPVRGLTETLARAQPSRLEGPSPSDVSLAPPAHPAARAWVEAAEATERAAHSVSRAKPEHLTVFGPAGDPGMPRTVVGAAVEARRGNHVAWSLTADLAAVAGTVAMLDVALAEEMRAAAERSGSQALARAAARLASPASDDVRVMAGLVLRMAETGPLMPAYDLRPASPRAVPVQSVWQVPAALDRTIELLDGAATLTGPQHRAFAGSLAAVAHRLSQALPPAQAEPLDRLATAAVLFAAQWTHTAIATPGDGTWHPPTQLAQVARVLGDATQKWLRQPPDASLQAQLARSATRLPTLVTSTTDNLRAALSAGHFLMPSDVPGRPFAPVLADTRWRVTVDARASALIRAAEAVRTASGPVLPTPAGAGRAPTAHRVLGSTAAATPPRVNHPAAQPAFRGPRPSGRRHR